MKVSSTVLQPQELKKEHTINLLSELLNNKKKNTERKADPSRCRNISKAFLT